MNNLELELEIKDCLGMLKKIDERLSRILVELSKKDLMEEVKH